MYDIPAVIFAGGKSSRMGADKALLPFNAYPTLSEYQYVKLKKYFTSVYLSSKEKKFDFTCDVILDTHTLSSPLVALVSIFDTLEAETVFVLSVDAPLVGQHVIAKLFHAYDSKFDAIIAKSPNGLEPLCGIYNRSILTSAQASLDKNKHKLIKLLENAYTQTVFFEEDVAFTNLNFKHEYEALLLR